MRYSLAREFVACGLIALLAELLPAQPPRVDQFGDPLPEGAIARLGSARLYHAGRNANRGMSIFSPDGKLLATVTSSGAMIWDAQSGRRLGAINLSTNKLPVAAFSADSRSIAIATAGTVGVFPAKGDHRFQFAKPPSKDSRRVDWVAILPDRRVIFIENRGDICVVDNNGAEQFRIAHGAAQPLAGLARDGKTFTIWNQENVDRWDLSRRARIATVKFPYYHSFAKLRLRADGTLFAVHLKFGGVVFWDPVSQKETGKLKDGKLQVDAGMEFTPDGKQLVTVTAQETAALVKHWEVGTGKLLKAFSIPLEDAGEPAISPDNKSVAFTTPRAAIPLWSLQTGKRLFDRGGLAEPAVSLSFAPGGRLIAAGGRKICTWETAKGKLLNSIALPFSCAGLAVDRSGDWGVVVSEDRAKMRIYSLKSHKLMAELRIPPNIVIDTVDSGSPAISPDSTVLHALAITSNSLSARLSWDIRTRQSAQIVKEARAKQKQLFVGPYLLRMPPIRHKKNGSRHQYEIGIHSLDGSQLLMNVSTAGEPTSFASNGPLLAAAARVAEVGFFPIFPNRLEVWEVASGERAMTFPEAKPEQGLIFETLAMTPDGRTLAVVNGRTEIVLIETFTGKKLSSLKVENVDRLAFSGDGRLLASGQDDGTILIWDVASFTHRESAVGPLTESEIEKLWKNLTGDARTARPAMERFACDSGAAIKTFRSQLKPVAPLTAEQFQKLIADLDSPKFAVREAASRELANFRFRVRPEIQAARDATRAPEVKRRLERILAMPRPARTGDELRQLRAIELLEGFNNRDALGVLRLIASGDPRAAQTQAAKEALERLPP